MNAPARKIKGPTPPKVVLATLDDLLAIPEEERRHELIDGTIYPRGAAAPHHGHVQRRLSAVVDPFDRSTRDNSPGGWWIVTEVDVYFDAKNTFRPDLSGWRREHLPRLPDATPVYVRPDWVCEILSKNRGHDLVKKKRVYHRHQVPHYWIIDPVEQLLYVHRWMSDGYVEVLVAERGVTVNAEPFEAMSFSLDVIFGDEPEDEPEETNAENAESVENVEKPE